MATTTGSQTEVIAYARVYRRPMSKLALLICEELRDNNTSPFEQKKKTRDCGLIQYGR